jgi:uncharacterized protein (TIGR02246 family)
MPSTAKKSSRSASGRVNRTVRGSRKATAFVSRKVTAATTIRRIGDDWARHWNAGELDGVVAAYAEDAVYLPPHHEAVHGRDAIREYIKAPLSHGVSDVAFKVTYIKQQGAIAWDVGTYRMTIPQTDGTKKEDHGKYLSVWRRVGRNWLMVADAWSSDLPPSA